MAIAFTYQGSIASTTAATVYTSSPTWTPAAGSLLVACVVGSVAVTPAVPDSVSGHGISYSRFVFSAGNLSTTHSLSFWVALAGGSPTSAAAAASWSANRTGCTIIEIEVTGADVSGTALAAIVQGVTANGTSTSSSETNLLAAAGAAGNLAIAHYCHLANEATTAGGGNWSEPAGADVTYATPSTASQVQVTTSTFDRTPAASWTTSSLYRVQAVEIKAAAGGNTINVPAGSLALTGIAPTVAQTANNTVAVPAGSLALTGIAPQVTNSSNQNVEVPVGILSLTGLAPTIQVGDNHTIAVPAGSLALTGNAPVVTNRTIGMDATSDLTSVHPTNWSYIFLPSGEPQITLQPRLTNDEGSASNTSWISPTAELTGLNGATPKIRFAPRTGDFWGWSATNENGMFSYDLETWTPFGNALVVDAAYIELSHTSAFTQDKVYVSRNRRWSNDQSLLWIQALEAAHPTLVEDVIGGTTFVVDTYTAQTDELGRSVRTKDLHAFQINDTSLMPASGAAKRYAVITGGVHASEDAAEWLLRGAVEWLCSSDSQAQALRRAFIVVVMPLLNAPGRDGGHFRGQFELGTGNAVDLNRHFSDTVGPIETVNKPRNALRAALPATIAWSIDLHEHNTNNGGVYVSASSSPLTAAYLVKLQAYDALLGDMGDEHAGFVSIWMTTELSAQMAATVEVVTQASERTDAYLYTYGENALRSIADLQAEGAFGIDVPLVTLALNGIAPQVTNSANSIVEVPAGVLSLTGFAPTIPANAIAVPAGLLTLTAFAPTVAANQTIAVPLVTLSLVANAPDVTATGNQTISPPTGVLTLVANTPIVTNGTETPANSGGARTYIVRGNRTWIVTPGSQAA